MEDIQFEINYFYVDVNKDFIPKLLQRLTQKSPFPLFTSIELEHKRKAVKINGLQDSKLQPYLEKEKNIFIFNKERNIEMSLSTYHINQGEIYLFVCINESYARQLDFAKVIPFIKSLYLEHTDTIYSGWNITSEIAKKYFLLPRPKWGDYLMWLEYHSKERFEAQGGEAIFANPYLKAERFGEGIIMQVGESPFDIFTPEGEAHWIKAIRAMPRIPLKLKLHFDFGRLPKSKYNQLYKKVLKQLHEKALFTAPYIDSFNAKGTKLKNLKDKKLSDYLNWHNLSSGYLSIRDDEQGIIMILSRDNLRFVLDIDSKWNKLEDVKRIFEYIACLKPRYACCGLEEEQIYLRKGYKGSYYGLNGGLLSWLEYFDKEEFIRQGGETIFDNPHIKAERMDEGIFIQVGKNASDVFTDEGLELYKKAMDAMPLTKGYEEEDRERDAYWAKRKLEEQEDSSE